MKLADGTFPHFPPGANRPIGESSFEAMGKVQILTGPKLCRFERQLHPNHSICSSRSLLQPFDKDHVPNRMIRRSISLN